MAEIAKSDLFFLITSAAVIVLTIIIAVIAMYLFFVIKDVKELVHKVKEESDGILDDFKDFRRQLREESSNIKRASAIATFLKDVFFTKRSRLKKPKEE